MFFSVWSVMTFIYDWYDAENACVFFMYKFVMDILNDFFLSSLSSQNFYIFFFCLQSFQLSFIVYISNSCLVSIFYSLFLFIKLCNLKMKRKFFSIFVNRRDFSLFLKPKRNKKSEKQSIFSLALSMDLNLIK